ncbi:hypothetical protein [Elizabethkingia anophelis]|uniref:DUF5045 domain-containing protein n=2 Tax=Elizabethkingia anophelis TaxID=1117645 RepID=A0A455ZFU5_9FLAO|nr:hypothetical protein [Elizabethkingia anophelis]ATC37713.1 hypothetical protein BAZ09_016350 [Elizabethkingia anophelis R26]ATC41393.1 hypothetical protein EAAG1_016565 [Elizabethkingia anophelis Ag1]ATC45070.1 hypothetical protein CMV41_16565 [Elizabethkingia anophelis]ATC48746.1 hypothetical protein CMV40_16565 [Elizabethkingia anophelis]KMU64394.1 hypothetical protein EZBTHKR_0696 [Elizabethkingia anophelis]
MTIFTKYKLKVGILCLIGFLLMAPALPAQNRLNDEAIVSQHKRQVFESWGDWRPYGKYFLGVQTNFAYSTVWGMLSPSRNRDYKDGEDIRPLKANGIEVQRLAQVELQRQEAEKIKINVDTLYKRNMQDLAHWTSLTVDADPLWLLYYKRMLSPINNFPDNPQNYTDWRLKDDESYQTLLNIGVIKRLQENLDLLKDKYKISRTVDMPRGKRFLMYHETLIGWRKFLYELNGFNSKTNLVLDYKKMLDKFRNTNKEIALHRDDKEIVASVMQDFKHRF